MRTRSLLLALMVAFLPACGDDDGPQGPADPATGEYAAVQFTTTFSGFITDHIADGAVVTLTLHEGGVTSGHAFVPGAGDGGEDADVDLAGTWDQSGNQVTLELDADIFLEDVVFVHDDGVMSADQTFQGVRVQITLVRDALL